MLLCQDLKIIILWQLKVDELTQLDSPDLSRVMAKAIKSKETNIFLGFLEGLVLDQTINDVEIKALEAWFTSNPEIYCDYPFDYLVQLLTKIVSAGGCIDSQLCQRFLSVVRVFISDKYYAKNTHDIQRLHGLLAGMACDNTINLQELKTLNQWMKDHDYLEDDVLFQEVYSLLRPVRTKGELSAYEVKAIFNQINKFSNSENHGILRVTPEVQGNPDFYRGQLNLENYTYCFTGSSARFTKKQWKDLVENNGATFVDDMSLSVHYLVICNKGNKAWAHVSYGRKFEQAKKWQTQGNDIKIITEDDFVTAIGLLIE